MFKTLFKLFELNGDLMFVNIKCLLSALLNEDTLCFEIALSFARSILSIIVYSFNEQVDLWTIIATNYNAIINSFLRKRFTKK